MRKLTLIAVCVFLASIVSFQVRCVGIRTQVLRLHVIANSDSAIDQSVKIAVRDALLEEGADLFGGSISRDEAEASILPRKEYLENCARRVLRSYGLQYDVRIAIGAEYFNTRVYDTITLPAGHYEAVRVVLGDGAGRNWWCVMFPPLCLPAATSKAASLDAVLRAGELRVVKSNPKYEIRFKIVELAESFFAWLHGENPKTAQSDL
jgi:stage II sporulation protein R